MAIGKIANRLPWWVKWIAAPVLVLLVFGGLIANVVGVLIGLLFKVLALVALVCALAFVVRKFKGSSNSRSDW